MTYIFISVSNRAGRLGLTIVSQGLSFNLIFPVGWQRDKLTLLHYAYISRAKEVSKRYNMNRRQLMEYDALLGFGDREEIVKAWLDEGDLAILTKVGSFHLQLNGTWRTYGPCKLKDFVMKGNTALALSYEGFLFSHSAIKTEKNSQKDFQLLNTFKGIIFVKIAIGKRRCLALAQDGMLYEWIANGFYRYELDWSLFDAILPENKMVTQMMCTWGYPVVLTRSGKVFMPTQASDVSKIEGMYHKKLHIFGESLNGKKVVQLAVGKYYIYALTACGEIYKFQGTSGFHGCLEFIDYKCHEFQSRGIMLWAADTLELVVILLESGRYITVRFSDEGEVLSKSITQSESPFEYFSDCEVPFNGCLFNLENEIKDDMELKDIWMRKLETIFDVKEGSDLIIEVQGKPIHCHKSIVSAHCEYLRNWIRNESMKESRDETLRLCLKDFQYDTIHAILNYIYTGRQEFHSFNIILELIEITEMWLEKELQNCFVDQAIKFLSHENVHLAKEKADRLDIQVLKEACQDLNQDLN